MTPVEFLQELLNAQDLTTNQEKDLQSHKKEISDFLLSAFETTPQIKYAGSREKGTMIRDRYDLDIVCYFPSSDDRSLRDIREDVSARLSERYFLEHKASAERILDLKGVSAPRDFHVDVVPGRFIEGTKDVFLHVEGGEKERMQTNLKTHIAHITDSGCVPVIRLAKLWACRNDVRIKTFVLELFVVNALSGSKSKENLQKSFLDVLEAFQNTFEYVSLPDPANSVNVVSRLVSATDKEIVAHAAGEAFGSLEKSNDVADWKRVFRESGDGEGANGFASPSSGPIQIQNPSSPWFTE